MGFNIASVLIMVSIVPCLISVAHAAEGNAVFYGPPPYTPSKCYGNTYKGTMVAGVSSALWNNGAACGKKYRVSCIRGTNKAPRPCRQGSVVVTVVDFCSKGCQGVINLSRDAFSQIADPDAGIVVVQYEEV